MHYVIHEKINRIKMNEELNELEKLERLGQQVKEDQSNLKKERQIIYSDPEMSGELKKFEMAIEELEEHGYFVALEYCPYLNYMHDKLRDDFESIPEKYLVSPTLGEGHFLNEYRMTHLVWCGDALQIARVLKKHNILFSWYGLDKAVFIAFLKKEKYLEFQEEESKEHYWELNSYEIVKEVEKELIAKSAEILAFKDEYNSIQIQGKFKGNRDSELESLNHFFSSENKSLKYLLIRKWEKYRRKVSDGFWISKWIEDCQRRIKLNHLIEKSSS